MVPRLGLKGMEKHTTHLNTLMNLPIKKVYFGTCRYELIDTGI